MCRPDAEHQRINPTSQVSLFSSCQEQCDGVLSVHWNVYQSSNTTVHWQVFNQTDIYEQIWFFGNLIDLFCFGWTQNQACPFLSAGRHQNNFTVSSELFVSNSMTKYWRFEVIYTFASMRISSSVMSFVINDPPSNGSCSISPLNGTTTTTFTVECGQWTDADGIRDYSLYGSRPLTERG